MTPNARNGVFFISVKPSIFKCKVNINILLAKTSCAVDDNPDINLFWHFSGSGNCFSLNFSIKGLDVSEM